MVLHETSGMWTPLDKASKKACEVVGGSNFSYFLIHVARHSKERDIKNCVVVSVHSAPKDRVLTINIARKPVVLLDNLGKDIAGHGYTGSFPIFFGETERNISKGRLSLSFKSNKPESKRDRLIAEWIFRCLVFRSAQCC